MSEDAPNISGIFRMAKKLRDIGDGAAAYGDSL
jgi:hypothetical protein